MKPLRIALLGGCLALLAAATPAVAEQVEIDGLPYVRYTAPVAAPEPLLASLAGACLAGAALLRRRR